MKIINSNQNIEWRKSLSEKDELNTVIEFDDLLKKQSFKGLQKINKRLNQKNIKKLKVTKKEIVNAGKLVTDDEKFALYEAIKNISYVSKSQLKDISNSIEPINGLTIWDKFIPIKSVGLYDNNDRLLAVGKLSEPLRKDPTIEYTLRARLDY